MRRTCLYALALLLSSTLSAQTVRGGSTTPPADGISRLITAIESGLVAGSMEQLRALTAPVLSTDGLLVLQRAVAAGGVSQAVVRERSRRPLADNTRVEVMAETFVSHGRNGRLATWLITVRPRGTDPEQYEILELKEPSAFDSLVKLTLNSERQFNVHNLQLQAPDMTLKMASGSAFVAEDDGGITALVLRGRGTVRFAPQDSAEQGQVRAFAGKPAFDSTFDNAFVRLDSGEFAARLSDRALTPVASVDPRELTRARTVFNEMSRKTYSVDLKDLTPDDWSFAPSFGSVVIEFKTPRYGWLTYARSPSEAEDVSLFDRGRNRNISSYISAEKAAIRGVDYSEDDLVSYDIERYALDVTFDPRALQIAGRASLSLRITSQLANVITLRLAESLAVNSVTVPSMGRLLTMRVVGQSSLIISLPSPVPRDTVLPLEIVYGGRLSPQAAERDDSPAGIVPIGSGDQQTRGDTPLVILPEQRWLYSNQVYWYPQSQVTDYATGTMRLQAPAEFQIVANGRALAPADVPTDGRNLRVYEFVVDRPARYLSCLITRLVEVGRTSIEVAAVAPAQLESSAPPTRQNVIDIDVLSTPRMAGNNRALPARVGEMLKVYTDLVGEAPYPHFTVAGVDDNLPGGHSPAFFAIWLQPLASTPYTWTSDPLSLDSKFPQFFLAHEIAHQWWGQAVGWKNYHEQWLSEGLAQYFAAVFAGTDRGPEMLDALIAAMRASAEDYTGRGPISLGYRLGHVQGDSRIFRGIIYNKSAVVLHMLRRLVGDQAFFGGIRRYYSGYRYTKAGTDDFRTAMQAETPIRLNRFFQRWIRETGVPQLRVSSRVESDGRLAVVRIEQVGDVFDLPLTVSVQYEDGGSDAVTIPVTDAITEHPIPLKGAVKRIITRDELTLADYIK